MTQQQDLVIRAEGLGQGLSQFRSRDLAGPSVIELADIVDGRLAPARGEGDRADRKGDQFGRMQVHDGHHVGTRAVDRRVDEALRVLVGACPADRYPVHALFDDVRRCDQGRRDVACDVKAFRIALAAGADVPLDTDDVQILGQDSIRDDQLVDDSLLRPLHSQRKYRGAHHQDSQTGNQEYS